MKPKFFRKVLSNGMTVILEKRDLPIVSVAFAVRSGAINEAPSEKGIHHYIEHMLYKGTKKRSAKKIAEEIEKNGGEINGFTSEEITAYWCRIPSKKLNIALDVLGDLVKNPLFNEKELEKERKVIFEEIKMHHDNPRLYVFDEIQKILYTGTMGLSIGGTIETMNSINREKIVKEFKEIYKPNNLILCAVGNVKFEELVSFAEKNFGKEKGKIPEQKFELKNEIKTEKRKGIGQANLVFAYHVPLAQDKKSYAAILLNTLMAGGMSSRLFEEIREKRNLAYSVKGISDINKRFAYNLIYVGTKKESIEKVKDLILKEFKKISTNLKEQELNQVKEQVIGNYQISMEDSSEQLVSLLKTEIQGNAFEFYNFEKNISKVKLNYVKELAFNALKDYSFFALIPDD